MDDIKRLADRIARKYRSRDPFEVIQGIKDWHGNIRSVFSPLSQYHCQNR